MIIDTDKLKKIIDKYYLDLKQDINSSGKEAMNAYIKLANRDHAYYLSKQAIMEFEAILEIFKDLYDNQE